MMETTVQTLWAVINNLRNLFRNKDRLVGVDDWDCFIGCLCTLEDIGNDLMMQSNQETEENLVGE